MTFIERVKMLKLECFSLSLSKKCIPLQKLDKDLPFIKLQTSNTHSTLYHYDKRRTPQPNSRLSYAV